MYFRLGYWALVSCIGSVLQTQHQAAAVAGKREKIADIAAGDGAVAANVALKRHVLRITLHTTQ